MVSQRERQRTRTRGRPNQPTQVQLGTGLSVWKGIIAEEYLPQLSPWSLAFRVYREMSDDVVVGALLESIKTPLLASPFDVIAGTNSTEDQKAKEFIEKDFFRTLDTEWPAHVQEMLEFLDYGFSLSEKVLEKRSDGRLHLRSLVPIGQETLDHWGEVDPFGAVSTFVQKREVGKPNSGAIAPMDKLLHFKFKGRKRNPEGRSLLRSLYRPWYFKKNLEALEAIGAERDVGNAPVATLKEGIRYTDSQITALGKALEGFRMDESVYVIAPAGVTIQAYGGGNKVYDIRAMIRDWQHLIRQRFFADFLSLGSEQVGTQALAKEMTTFFGLALRSIQEIMLAVWNRQLIPWIFAWNNWAPVSGELPRLEWLRPEDSNLQSLAQAYQMLIEAGIIDIDDAIKKRVRLQMGLPVGPLSDKPDEKGSSNGTNNNKEAIPPKEGVTN